MIFKGFVQKILTRTGTGRRGSWTAYNAIIEKDDGTTYEQPVGFGFDKPNIKEGDYVKIESEDVRGFEQAVSVKKLKNPPARSSKKEQSGSSSRGNSGGGGNRFDGTGIQNRTNPEDAKRMSYANARTTAVEVISLLLAHDALPLTATKSKAAQAKRNKELLAAIDKLTVQFFNDGMSLRLLDTVADAGVLDNAPSSTLPDDSSGEEEEEDDDDDDKDVEEEEEEEEEEDE